MAGDIAVDGTVTIGEISINDNGLFYNDHEFYHKGNSNKEDIDWDMQNSHIYGTLLVNQETVLNDTFSAIHGFSLGADENNFLYSAIDEIGNDYVRLNVDLDLSSNCGIRLGGKYIVKVRGHFNNIVSFSAPGMTMNLGDSDNGIKTEKIALQTGIYNANSAYCMVSVNGDGNFPNSFSAGCGNSGPSVLKTYYRKADDFGVVLTEKVRFGSIVGPSFYIDDDITRLNFESPYIHSENNLQQTDYIKSYVYYVPTSSLLKNQSNPWSASLCFDTDAEFFVFRKPAEAVRFSIVSSRYKTRLEENTLFFNDTAFIEGVSNNGILYHGNAYFNGNLSSKRFSDGFFGEGWSIRTGSVSGNIVATFDELIVRKKMRIYELEVQKSNITNGSLWVSDSCSGDFVEEVF
jgi:hypothetical protein